MLSSKQLEALNSKESIKKRIETMRKLGYYSLSLEEKRRRLRINTKRYRERHPEEIKEYNDKNKDIIKERQKRCRSKKYTYYKEYWTQANDEKMFGGKRQEALEYSNFCCEWCGLSQEQSYVLFNRGLSIDHKDGRGCNVSKGLKNNDLSNLQVLCHRCHGKKTWQQRKGSYPMVRSNY